MSGVGISTPVQQGLGSISAAVTSQPRVSIITAAHNAMPFIRETVASVLAQSFEHWQWIIVDDGSTDETTHYLSALTDPRIEVVLQVRRGVSSARNAGLDRAKGEFVTFLDADDTLPPDSLTSRVQYLDDHPDVTLVDGVIALMDAELSQTIRLRCPGEKGAYFSRLVRLDPTVFFGVAVMIRRRALLGTRFEPTLTHSEDLHFLLQASNGQAWFYGSVRECVYAYRTGRVSAMSDMDGLEKGYLFVFRETQHLDDASAEDLAYLYRRIRRILIRTWLRRGRPIRALSAYLSLRALRRRCLNAGGR